MDPSKDQGSKNTALHHACLAGDLKRVTTILSDGHDINARGMLKRTPVMLAAWKGHRKVLDFLLDKGADVGIVDGRHDSILHLACVGGGVEIVKPILSYTTRVDINEKGNYGKTPIMNAAWTRHTDVLQLLVSKGADLSSADDGGDSILHWACVGGHAEMVKYVLSMKRFDINSRGVCERTPVMEAAVHGHDEVFHLIVRSGGDLTLADAKARNILHLACRGGNLEIVKYVLSKHIVDINSRDQMGNTAVMDATVQRHREMVNLLVSKGAHSR
ncbi:serine/threonine-protein phosphatase 6 regulatory ankyrin repeat subunit A-like [Haliotis cracherodii]|uniref:serine/threonine-protein phosphatase 6 regulatory ankyrin repeat subunit A-like n=1 Tax=Haliotis cracherodii TaxID=6455 RepID=UPI0039E7B5F4